MKPAHALVAVVALGCVLAAAPARADSFITPSVGVDFGGNAGDTLKGAAKDSNKLNVGLAIGWMGGGVIGVEENFSWAPNFFGSGGTVDTTRVATLMSNLIIGIPLGGQHGAGARPYVSGGVGWIGRRINTPSGIGQFSQNDFGYDLGAGLMGYFADHVGLQADVRYFRNTQDTSSNTLGLAAGQFKFFRGSIGVLFRF